MASAHRRKGLCGAISALQEVVPHNHRKEVTDAKEAATVPALRRADEQRLSQVPDPLHQL